jgi:cell wall-associated NlpC family hydrolase/DNA-binding transcriptional ArsR family regulator
VTDVFGALADPNRRRLLEELAGREASVTELARTLPVTRQAVAKHMAALAGAGLVDSRRVGRERLYRLNAGPLDGAVGWMTRVGAEWETRLARLQDHLAVWSCGVDVAPVRAEPDAASEQVTQALRGEPLAVRERRRGWALVETGYGYPGWVEEVVLSPEPPGEWPPPARDGDPVEEARGYLGAPYLWGGMTASGIDCSGLVHMSFRQLGRLVPRDARDQESAGETVESPRLGDLVTYGSGAQATHIAFWLGDGRILHAASSRGVVEEAEPEELSRMRRRFVRLPQTS